MNVIDVMNMKRPSDNERIWFLKDVLQNQVGYKEALDGKANIILGVSGVVFGLTAALYGRIDIVDGVVQQGNFDSYPMLTLAQTPQVETWIVPSTRAPGGVGETSVPPLAPAVANALFLLTGKRQRSLPLQV